MYTQCPDCATVFRVSADILRAAQGEVRCGVCSTTFDALENLSEKPFTPATAESAAVKPEDTITVEEVPGTEDIELSTSVEILQIDPASPGAVSLQAPPPEEPPLSEEDRAMEFHGNPADLDKLFVEMPRTDLPRFAEVTLAGGDLDRTDEYPIVVLEEAEEAPEEPVEIVLESPREPDPLDNPRILIPDEMRRSLAAEAALRATTDADFGENVDTGAPARRWPWVAGAAGLALLLLAQVVHSQRDELVRKPGVGALLARSYSLLGMPFAAPTDLSAFELRRHGAANDTGASGQLLLRASIVNRASFAQPYPLLRLALQDRYGTTVAVSDFQPSEYLRGPDVPRLLAAGARADAELRVVDPGPDAVGFEMDLCAAVTGGVRCASQSAAPSPAP